MEIIVYPPISANDQIILQDEQMRQRRFVNEALSIWDKLEGRLLPFPVFISAYVGARQATWAEVCRWN